MSAIAFLRELLDAGLDLDGALIAAEKFERKALEAIEARKAKDRERERIPRNSTESTEKTEFQERSPSRPLSPQTPQTPTHPPGEISTRGREEAAFGRFWSAYPRKISKAEAWKAFARAWRKLPPMDEEAILTGGLERAMASWTEARFIPHASTWLNQERWTDEPTIIELKPRHERPHSPDAKLAAKQANYARAWTGSEIAARHRGEP